MLRLGALLVFVTSLSGCAFHQWRVNEIGNDLAVGNVQAALTRLEGIKVPKRDEAQIELNRGMLKHYLGRFEESNQHFDVASDVMAEFQAVSVVENIGAATVNETLRKYIGTPEERVLLHFMSVLNYLSLQELDAARVEVLQADVLMKTLDGKAQLPAMHLLTGMVYELSGEYDNALISYRHALKLFDENGQGVPTALKQALLSLTDSNDTRREFESYQSRFKNVAKGNSGTFVIFLNGVVDAKKQDKTVVYDPVSNAHHSIAVPYYLGNNTALSSRTYPIYGEEVRLDLIEDVNLLAEEALDRDLPSITALALARVVARYQAIRKAREEQNHVLAFALNVSGVAAEMADLRSWNTLPSAIYFSYVELNSETSPRVLIVNNLNGDLHEFH